MGERAVLELSETFVKINDDDHGTKLMKMRRSFDLNINESSKIKPLCKARSLSSHFVVNFDDQTSFTNNPRSNEETGLLSIYESSLSPSQHFEEVNYKVRLNSKVEKHILQGVSGSVFPGEILALMGPSGGGKTTLLNLLSGRVKCNGGIITYNDQLYTKSLKGRIGFVLQDDTVFPHLTVKETLTYSALLRLPNSLSKQQKNERAMNVLSQLGLERCQNTMVGGKFVRGVSGGEKKRVCIGNEILLNPSLLFLDEPTSGLDSTTALRIIQMLQDIAQGGKTVVTTIHQPSSRLFSKFDKLILLSNGCSLYFGKASEAMVYFSSIGCWPLIAMNPAEFLIDLASGNVKEKSIPSELQGKFLSGGGPFETKDTGPSPSEVHKYLLGAYESRASTMESIKVEMLDHKLKRQKMSDVGECGASWSAQLCILFRRGIKERRHEYLSSLRVIQVISTAVIAGLIWWNPDASSVNNNMNMVEDQAGLLFFICVYWGFFPVFTAIFTFPLERAMLAKERSVDMYKLSAYFIARNTSDLPLDLFLPLIFLVIVYFMVGLNPTFSAFSLTLLSIFLTIIAAQGVGLSIGAAFMDVKKATTVASVTVMTFMLSGGFFINKVPPFMHWIRYVSLNYHTYKLLLRIQYSCNGHGSVICNSPFVKAQGRDHAGIEVGAMLVMIIGYRLLTYILLRRMKLISTQS
ncbi:ABC-2 type transporter family protein [Perilla frutescens var. hirtella]|uniref:ABC-2 type transporter family protein n=1 Tax=Perilla frutescens var. hirtella TaxID=608512 RepID=A0AAD4P2Z6_PERFH|nr:ABC-2 type transporter family protein [Perilla frutescens var. hirtella]